LIPTTVTTLPPFAQDGERAVPPLEPEILDVGPDASETRSPLRASRLINA
jgi:hypothetical protein